MNEGQVVLVVEDDDDDLFLLNRELAKIRQPTLRHARDGRAAIDYLAGTGSFSDRTKFPLPTIVLLDLKLPHLNGHEVLQWIRARPEFQSMRVFVLTGSDEPRDRARVNEIGADGYFVKPLLSDQLRELLR